MNKSKSAKIILAVFLTVASFSMLQKKMGQGLAFGYGYGYNSAVVSVNSLTTTDRSPEITGAYTGGPYQSIYVTIFNSDGSQAMFGANVTDNGDGTWTLPKDAISPALEVGTYDVSVMVTNIFSDTTYDGTDNELKIVADFSKVSISSELEGSKVTLKFVTARGTALFMVSKSKSFKGAEWKALDDHFTMKLSRSEGERTYYVKFKDEGGTESKVFKESVDYTPVRFIKNSKDSIRQGAELVQSGKKFSKNSQVLLYFSNSKGGYYAPVKMMTDAKGNFKTNYTVKKLPGKYKWYAVDEKTGKKSDVIKYTVKK